MNPETYYDFLAESYPIWYNILTTLPAAAGVILFAVRARQASPDDYRNTFIFLSTAAAAVFIGLVIVHIYSYSEVARLQNHLKLGLVSKVEGPIQNYVELPPGHRGAEYFDVSGVRFEVSESWSWAGFGRLIRNGSRLKQGEFVQIYYLDRHILRINILINIQAGPQK